jgi:hypothetical protein
MAMVFGDLEGILLMVYMLYKTAITGDACAPAAAVLWNLKEVIEKK